MDLIPRLFVSIALFLAAMLILGCQVAVTQRAERPRDFEVSLGLMLATMFAAAMVSRSYVTGIGPWWAAVAASAFLLCQVGWLLFRIPRAAEDNAGIVMSEDSEGGRQ
jgi:hypothetical protein